MRTLSRSRAARHHVNPKSGGSGGTLPPPQNFGFNFSTAMSQPAGVYVLSNGTYSVNPSGTYTPTGSANGGRVTLVAESQGGVLVQMNTQAAANRKMELLNGTGDIDFIGIAFDGGAIKNDADHTRWWRCDHQNFDLTYLLTNDGQPINNLGVNGRPTNVVLDGSGQPTYIREIPRTFQNISGSSNNQFYGCDYHHTTTTTFYLEGLNQHLIVQGCRVYDIDHRVDTPGDAGVDPQSHIVPGPSCPPGGISDINILDHYSEDTYVLFGTGAGSNDGIRHRRYDTGNCNPSPLLYQVNTNNGFRHVNDVREDVRFVFAGGGTDLGSDPGFFVPTGPGGALEGHFGPSVKTTYASYIQLTDTATLQGSSPQALVLNTGVLAGITSKSQLRAWSGLYANIWRNANPYNTWPAFLGITL